jgi:pimeloyl-ACP methyl ester carboxylesterase
MQRNLWKWRFIFLLTAIVSSCSDEKDPAPAKEETNLVEANLIGSRSAAELQLLIQLSGRNVDPSLVQYDVDIYKVVYKTTYQTSEVNASGLIFLPKTGSPINMISFQHGTIVRQSDAPSLQDPEGLEVISYAAMASMGFITVVPDMIGFGESKEIFHPYYVEEPTASAVIDNVKAAAALSDAKQMQFNHRLFLAGYSQGGYATMATHKAIEANPLEGFELIATFPAAGGYDLKSLQEYFFSADTYDHPFYLAYVGKSYGIYYDKPQLLTDFFNEPYATNIPSLFNGINGQDNINAGLTDDIKALVKEDVILHMDSDPKYEYLSDAFQENSLVDWKPTIPMYMYHGDADTTVPYQNSEITYGKLIDNGADPEKLKLITLPGADHSTGIEPYIEDLIKRLQLLK